METSVKNQDVLEKMGHVMHMVAVTVLLACVHVNLDGRETTVQYLAVRGHLNVVVRLLFT